MGLEFFNDGVVFGSWILDLEQFMYKLKWQLQYNEGRTKLARSMIIAMVSYRKLHPDHIDWTLCSLQLSLLSCCTTVLNSFVWTHGKISHVSPPNTSYRTKRNNFSFSWKEIWYQRYNNLPGPSPPRPSFLLCHCKLLDCTNRFPKRKGMRGQERGDEDEDIRIWGKGSPR